jgi:regulator of protease activity HflC (stomatin/prohibitin superfamily)
MPFPYPQDPNEWQTAYTRDQAHQDSGKSGNRLATPLLFGFLIVLAYLAWQFKLPVRILTLPFVWWLQLGIGIAVVLILFALFSMAVFTPPLRFAQNFFTNFHQPPRDVDPYTVLNYRLFGKSKLPPPLNLLSQFKYILIRDGRIEKEEDWPAWSARHLGGPCQLIIFDGNALYLERGNRFSRVVGPGEGGPFLEWYETIKYVVDLRPKVKTGNIDVWTKDGIRINLEARLECRIGNPGNREPDSNLVYPYDPEAVKKAVERLSLRWPVREEGQPSEFDWIEATWGQVTGIIPGYIGSRTLDDLLLEKRHGGQILSSEAMQDIFKRLNNATNQFGVYVLDFQIVKITPPKEVDEEQKEFWKAEKQSIATIRDGQAKAFNIRSQEKVRAEAQRDLIVAIANGLEKNKDHKYSDALLLSLSGVLDTSLQDPLMRAYLAKETLDTLEKLQTMLTQKSA